MLKRLLFVVCMATIVMLVLATFNPLGVGHGVAESCLGSMQQFFDAAEVYGIIAIIIGLMLYFVLKIIR